MPRFDTCFDPGFDNRSKVGVWSRRHSMLDACGFHGCFDLWVTSMIASIASLVLSFVAEELGCLDASIYSLRRYSLRHSLGCSMLRCFSASLECFWARLDHPGLSLAAYVTLLFADQKNRDKNARRTQKRTHDLVLCPVRRAASLIERIRRLVPNFSGATTINTYTHQSRTGPVTLQLASGFLRDQLRHTCATLGGKNVFGFDRMDIGTKSIRSGAAMGLFLANHSTERIMLMGRWLSQAFLVYIRPQVIEWTNNMSQDMIRHDSFTDASGFDMADPDIARVPPRRFNGPDNSITMPALCLAH